MKDLPEALSHFLRTAPPPEIRRIRQCLERARAIQADLKRVLPESVAPHCTAVPWIEQNTLLLSADTPVWALRLRFLLPRITRHMASDSLYDDLGTVRIRVAPKPSRTHVYDTSVCGSPRTLGIGATTAGQLRTLASGVADPALQQALERLASRCPDSEDA